jgi:hypothetical protein
MQRSSASLLSVLSRWSIAPKVRVHTSPGQRPHISEKDTRAEDPIHPLTAKLPIFKGKRLRPDNRGGLTKIPRDGSATILIISSRSQNR